MFENASIMILIETGGELQIRRLETNRETQTSISQVFAKGYMSLTNGKEAVAFDGKYTPDEDEVLYIENFEMGEAVLRAIKNPLDVSPFYPSQEQPERIKAIFVGEQDKKQARIAFQKFKKEQYIATKGIHLFFNKQTFVEEKRFGISVSENVDCVYEGERLKFYSYYIARQLFDLKDYYRSATDGEVKSFTELSNIQFADVEMFRKQADSRVRKRVASIIDSEILLKYSSKDIRKIGKSTGVEINIKKDKIIIPKEKSQMKVVLGFLDEGVYKGVFSKETFMTNSKRLIGG
ncbi:MAG: DUF4868 domain-containing protein [Bacteroides sp.]|nr:DUF4868 domain-containing protein [Bacteroides sp.]MCM1549980.1 DUF4868 domain-containing protein [Clostridium sp.]